MGGLPDAHSLFDLLIIAPFLIMPSVWPVPASRSVDFVTWTSEGMTMGRISLRIGRREVIQKKGSLAHFEVFRCKAGKFGSFDR